MLNIKGEDGNDIRVVIYQPTNFGKPEQLPVLIYYHGGGMAIGSTDSHDLFLRKMATYGLVVVAPNFRNSALAKFPAGLKDCLSTLTYIHQNRDTLKLSDRIYVGGESGGGNLAAATCIRAKRLGVSQMIKGQVLLCPYVSPETGKLPSHFENKDYFVMEKDTQFLAQYYTEPEDSKNAEAWPIYATIEDLKGLPPAFVLVNECDPLRDDGLEYARKLFAAGVQTTSITHNGTLHGASLFLGACSHISKASMQIIASYICQD
jgi:acetyl esterase/lipase